MRVLIICSRLRGGVANYFRTITDYLIVEADLFEIGAHKENESILEKIRHLFENNFYLSE